MSANENAAGALRLLKVSPGSEERVIVYLGRYYKGTKKEQIAERIASLPLTLSRKVPKAVAQKVLTELTALGATGQFVAHQAAGRTGEPKVATAPVREKAKKEVVAEGSLETTLNQAFRQERLRSPVPFFYRLGLFVVVFAMVLLPLLYLAMIGGVGYLVYWHATENVAFFQTIRSAKAALFSYAAPLVVGVLLVFFMIKPLFARRHETWKDIEMLPKAEPLLAAFIQRICRSVGAPMPTLIRFDNQVNASASFRRGFSSFFGNDLVLTIGMPLAGGLSLSEFAGVLAHEFGHFAQASGMRLTYVIRSINGWFSRVVYEEDEWDVRLRQWSRDLDARIGIIFYLARFFIWLTRKILWALMQLGHLISCFMLRQMEFDADRYEAGLVGSDIFAATSGKLPQLSVAHSRAFDDINESWKEGKLPDNVASLTRFKAEQMEEKTRQAIKEQQGSARTGFLDTHPADRDRIASAGNITASPVFCWPRREVPEASVLFKDFDALARRVTLEHYRQSLGRLPDRESLIDVAAMVRSQAVEQELYGTLESYFLDRFTPWRPLGLTETFPPAASDPKAVLGRLKSVRQEISRIAGDHDDALRNHFNIKSLILKAAQARSLLKSGFSIKAGDFSLPQATMDGVETADRRYAERAAESERVLAGFEALQLERLRLGHELLQVPAISKRLGGDESLPENAAIYWQALSALQAQLPAVEQMNLDLAQLDILARQLDDNSEDEKLINAIRWKIEDLRGSLDDLGRKLAGFDYPFDHSREGLTLGSYIVGAVPERDDLGAFFDVTGEAIQHAKELISRLAARLAETAGRVEEALALPPLFAAKEPEERGTGA